jgi:hypothetical protein
VSRALDPMTSVLEALATSGLHSREGLARATGLSRIQVSRRLSYLHRTRGTPLPPRKRHTLTVDERVEGRLLPAFDPKRRIVLAELMSQQPEWGSK